MHVGGEKTSSTCGVVLYLKLHKVKVLIFPRGRHPGKLRVYNLLASGWIDFIKAAYGAAQKLPE